MKYIKFVRQVCLIIAVSLATYCGQLMVPPVYAIDCGSDVPSEEGQLQEYIASCTSKLKELSGQKKTLAEAITYYNTQIKLTQAKVASTEKELVKLNVEITDLSGKISSLDYSLDELTKLFVARVRESYIRKDVMPVLSITDSTSGIPTLIRRLEYVKKIRNHDREILVALEKSRLDYHNQKSEKEEKQAEVEALKKKLATQQASLTSQKASKDKLLADTQNDERRYTALLAAAKGRLSSLARYADSVGVSLIPHQELSDDWGKYYNQRDMNWGTILVNGDQSDCRGGSCTLARIGCLATSYAMVVTHYGGNITPADVATNPANFYLSTADFSSPGPAANGHAATALENPSLSTLRDALSAGKAVIVGMSMNGGSYPSHYSDHWVVLRSVDGDSFRINDPAYPGAMNVSLRDHYASWTIIQARIYN